MGIRPEYIDLGQQEGENIFPAQIMQAVEGISTVSYRFRLAPTSRASTTSPPPCLSPVLPVMERVKLACCACPLRA